MLQISQSKDYTLNSIYGTLDKTKIISQEFECKTIKYVITSSFLSFQSKKDFSEIESHKDYEKIINETIDKLTKQYNTPTSFVFGIDLEILPDKSLYMSCYGLN